MDYSDLRICIWAVYTVLFIWQTSRDGYDTRSLYMLVGYAVIQFAVHAAERLHTAWRRRIARLAFLELDPDVQEQRLRTMWLGIHRQFFRDAIEAAGRPEREGAIERFPFPATALRENTVIFWLAVATAIVLLSAVFLFPQLARTAQWALWCLAFLDAVGVAWLHARGRHLRSILEISPFAISLVEQDGERRTFQWSTPMYARNRRVLRRVDLLARGDPRPIPLDYSRLGILRIYSLVRQLAGWEATDAA